MSEDLQILEDAIVSSLFQEWTALQSNLTEPGAFALASKANGAGEHMLAMEILETVTETPGIELSRRLLHEKAIALARMGWAEQALDSLTLIQSQAQDADTLGLMGSVLKDLAEGVSDPQEKLRLLTESARYYRLGFDQFSSPYCGINAAMVAILLDDYSLAETIAAQTLETQPQEDRYYDTATRAEAALILKREEEAARLYRAACELAGDRWADIKSTRNQCRLLAAKIYGRKDRFEACFPAGAVAIFGGHPLDLPSRFLPCFPATAISGVSERISAWLKKHQIRFSVSSASAGADLLFLEQAQSAGVETYVVLPYSVPLFLENNVKPHGADWEKRFLVAMRQAESVTIISEEVADDQSSAYNFTNLMVAAHGTRIANARDLPRRALAVWDLLPPDGLGGAGDAVACWAGAKIEVDVIHPTVPEKDGPIVVDSTASAVPFEAIRTAIPTGYQTLVRSILYLRFESYSRLKENQHHLFQQTVLEPLAELLATTPTPPEGRYGFGPDYVFIFANHRSAGLFAMKILQTLKSSEFLEVELPKLFLHVGPLQRMVNPILNQYVHEGAELLRARGIMADLQPGIPYCSEAVASLTSLDAIRDFECEYIGRPRRAQGQPRSRLFRIQYR